MTKDKLYHLIAGFAISLIFGLFNPIIGLIIAISVGVTKDVVWDLCLKRGTFEVLDIFATEEKMIKEESLNNERL